MKSPAELIAEAKQRIREVSPEEVQAMRERGDTFTLVDVREPNEWATGHIPDAVPIPRGTLEWVADERVPRTVPVVVYCAAGGRSALAADTLQGMGYEHVTSLCGGIVGWADAGGEIDE
ncbi:MAG: rhodanese-like domain-containing protein [Candidatus Eremiobacteraeota bacterium]|nr:rhodanese-like domain-containing protein [Candidatus Eremiobacteraeota bacterium]